MQNSQNPSGRLYRIVSFERAVQLFESKELHFSHPSKWDDPYETQLVHGGSSGIFAQCWCTRGMSDAMWRIYSQSHMGIRLSTSTKKLAQALSKESKRIGYGFRCESVDYMSAFEIKKELVSVRNSLLKEYDQELALEPLFMKRSAFDHEAEYRAAIHLNETPRRKKSGLKIKVDPFSLIDSVVLDPRAPNELVDAFTYYFKNKIGFKKRVSKSVLYKDPGKMIVE